MLITSNQNLFPDGDFIAEFAMNNVDRDSEVILIVRVGSL